MNRQHPGKTFSHNMRNIKKTQLALAVGLVLAGISIAHATDYTISGASGQISLTNGDTLSVLSSGSVTAPGGVPNNWPVYTGGVISTLSNAGSITASGANLYNWGITNDIGGVITDLTNTGSISVSGGTYNYGIANYGTITTLTNTGSITYSGGTLNVGIANFGTITSFINGQTTPLTYYSNTPSYYYTYFNTPSSYGKVNFTGLSSYTLPNYGLRIAAGQNYAAGTYTGVMTSDSALTISSLAPVAGVTYHLVDAGSGLSWNLVIDSVSSSRVTAGALALGNTPALGAAGVIDATPGLLSLFTAQTTNSQLSTGASQTLPLLTGASSLAAFDTLSGINHVIQARQDSNLGLSAGDDFYGDRKVWLKPFGSWASQDNSNAAPGFSANTWGAVLGFDATPSTTTRLGLAFAYAKSDINGRSAAAPQSSNVDTYQLIGYGSHSLDANTELNFQLGAGQNRNSGQRLIALTSSVADSSYDSYSALAGVGLGRSFTLSETTRITPSVRADYTWIKDASYSETGAGTLNLNVASRSAEQLILSVDGKLTHDLDSRTKLAANLGVGYDVINDRAQITATFAGAPGASFVTYGIDPSPWIGRAGLGIVHTLQSGMEVSARYDGEAREGFTNQTASLKARWAF
ncbi:MAG: autotransporter domain-containing protein [Hydrogenophilales bacterium]|nr:autotransporter domain-containing protein [Hydrogenophilales bacterium]